MQNPTMFQTLCTPTFLFEAWKAVKAKNASGGIDGISVAAFEDNLETYLREISESLKLGKWIPEPYLRIEIPKKDNEKRKLGLLSVKDKIVQQAIKMLVEPYFENEFVDNSYGYRPNKGHYKAVQRTWSECKKKKYNFFLKNTWVGVTNLLVLDGSVSQGTIDLFHLFCHYADLWFDSHSQQQSMLFLDSLFHFALSGQKCDYKYFRHHLNLLHWENEDPRLLMTLINLSDAYNIHSHLCHTINDLFPYAHAIPHDNYICVLCNLRMRNSDAILQDFSPWLKKSGYYGCCSSSFQELELLSEHFQQTEITARFCPGEIGQIYSFQNYLLRYGFSIMKQNTHTSLIHPAVTQLLEYDAQNHTEFCLTLYMYIRHERSQSHTAAALNIHRNTLTYRLGRLRELIDCDLELPEVRLHILVSYELLKLDGKESVPHISP